MWKNPLKTVETCWRTFNWEAWCKKGFRVSDNFTGKKVVQKSLNFHMQALIVVVMANQRQVYIVLTSERTFTRALAILSSLPRLKKLVAFPLCPMRPVLPILCTNSSISDGKSKLMTCLTLSMSSPRAATLVAISTGHRPFLKSAKASSLSCCRRSLKINENTVQLFLFLEINAWSLIQILARGWIWLTTHGWKRHKNYDTETFKWMYSFLLQELKPLQN